MVRKPIEKGVLSPDDVKALLFEAASATGANGLFALKQPQQETPGRQPRAGVFFGRLRGFGLLAPSNLEALKIRLDDEDRATIAFLPKGQRYVKPPFAPDWTA